MRQIKFRAWDKKENKMYHNVGVVGSFIILEHEQSGYDFYEIDLNLYDNMTDDYHIMQYTGLRDRNGIEIYEGDIVIGLRRIYDDYFHEKVTYLNGCYMFGGFNAHEYFNKHQQIEVIGNVYDNPDLLND